MPAGLKDERGWPFDTLKQLGLPKRSLVRKGWEYQAIYKKGKRFKGNNFTLIVAENNLGYNRLGISIHSQIKGAVKRNRIKRIIRESFRLARESYPLESDIVVTVRPGFSLNSPEAMTEAVSRLL